MAGTDAPITPRWILAVHAVQLVFAIVVLGLAAYGVRWIAYNALIFSIVVCLCTMAVCAYLIASQLFLHKMFNVYVAIALHSWLLIFWVVDLGLVANLARMWGDGERCYTTTYSYGYYCYTKRDLAKRESTTLAAYYGALAAGAVFAAVELVLWAVSAVVMILAWNKQRTNASAVPAAANQAPPPQYNGPNNQQAVPMEKYNQPPAQVPQTQYAQPGQPQQQQYTAPYANDPVPRQDTVSPVSQVGGGYVPPSHNVPGLNSPQHTGQYAYPPNASELHTAPYNPNIPELGNQR